MKELIRTIARPDAIGSSQSLTNLLEIIDDLAASRLNVGDTLTAATAALSVFRSGTWVAVLMTKDPNTSLVESSDHANPSMASYVAELTTLGRPGPAPTSSLSKLVIEADRPIFLPHSPYDEFASMLTPSERDYVNGHPPPIALDSLSLLIVPMHSRGAIIGTLGLFERDFSNQITERDGLWLQVVADRLGRLTENAQIYDDATMRLDRLSALETVSRAMSAGCDLSFTLELILEQVRRQLKVDAADILLMNEKDGRLAVAAASGFMGNALPRDIWLSVEDELIRRALSSRHIESVAVPSDFSDTARRWVFAREGFRAYRFARVAPRGKFAGAIEVFHRSALSPDREWLSFLEVMACIAATAIDIAALNEELRIARLSIQPGERGISDWN